MPTTPIDRMTATLDFQATALSLQAQRAKVLASNIANADTPNYQAKDFDFSQALSQATQAASQNPREPARTHPAHLSAAGDCSTDSRCKLRWTVTRSTWTRNAPPSRRTPSATRRACVS